MQYSSDIKISQQLIKTNEDWPVWDMPDSNSVFEMVKMVTPYVRFLHPDIVGAVVEDNNKNRVVWNEKLIIRNINPNYYIWDKSSCAFPGIRRYAGKKEMAFFHNKQSLNIPEALCLDDNTFPRQIWSFVLRGKATQKFGPKQYALAHLADHKDYKSKIYEEFDKTGNGDPPDKFYGLFSCVSNTVYMPTNLIKLTDFNLETRLLLLNKAQNLYASVCNILPPSLLVKQPSSPAWQIDNFNWAELVGAGSSLKSFFEFRTNTINSLLDI